MLRWLRWRGGRRGLDGDSPRDLGRAGERLAARYLVRCGYRVLESNLAVGGDEADLIVLDPDRTTVVVVEVKARRASAIAPEAAIDRRKRRCLTRLAHRIRHRPEYADRPMRFDVVCVSVGPDGRPGLRHYVDAFPEQR